MNIQQAFNIAAANYDNLRRSLIPCFDDFYSTAVEVISTCQRLQDVGSDRIIPKALDLGAGTGLYAGMVQAALPKIEFTLVDLADKMLEQAKARWLNRCFRELSKKGLQQSTQQGFPSLFGIVDELEKAQVQG